MKFSLLYKRLIKPILFLMDPEFVHNAFTIIGEIFGKSKLIKKIIRKLFRYEDEILTQNLFGKVYKNPVGLAAGFDYNAKLTNILEDVGFAFESVGTVTNLPYEGNKKPRLARLPNSKSLLVNKGFKSNGIVKILNNINPWDENSFNVGISIGATNNSNCTTPETQIEDILNSFQYLKSHKILNRFAYIELNISCPNVLGSGSLANPRDLETVLKKIRELEITKPLFIKFQLEIEWNNAKELIDIMIKYNVEAIIISNLLKSRKPDLFVSNELNKMDGLKGNFSGKPTFELSNELISNVYKEFGDRIKIIGLGGIFNAQDAFRKIELGATLVQLVTGMIFEGPQVIGDINKGLVQILKEKGFKNISDAIGSAHPKKKK